MGQRQRCWPGGRAIRSGLGDVRGIVGLPRSLQFDPIAIGIPKIDRGSESFRTIESPRLLGFDSEMIEVCTDRGFVEGIERQCEMIHIGSPRIGLTTSRSTQRRSDLDQVDQAAAGTKLNQSEIIQASLDRESKYIAIEVNRAFEIPHSQHDMIEALGLDDVQAAIPDRLKETEALKVMEVIVGETRRLLVSGFLKSSQLYTRGLEFWELGTPDQLIENLLRLAEFTRFRQGETQSVAYGR
jgi:hypothetical protein